MPVLLGVDTLTYHCRLAAGEISIDDVVREVAGLGAAFVQLNAVHLRRHDDDGLAQLADTADELGVSLTLSGDVLGLRDRGDSVADGLRRLAAWMTIAQQVRSPFVRISSGFYRAEFWRTPDKIRAEQDYLISTLQAVTTSYDGDLRILLENHSDFTPQEYLEILDAVADNRVGVFLDVINPISVLADPLAVVKQLVPRAAAGHVKDYRFASVYVEDRFHRRGFDVRWCYPGEGVADLAPLLAEIRRRAGDGFYHLSIEGLDSRAGIADQRERLTASLEHISEMMAA